jgi:hypothetical protein
VPFSNSSCRTLRKAHAETTDAARLRGGWANANKR